MVLGLMVCSVTKYDELLCATGSLLQTGRDEGSAAVDHLDPPVIPSWHGVGVEQKGEVTGWRRGGLEQGSELLGGMMGVGMGQLEVAKMPHLALPCLLGSTLCQP